MNLTEIINAAIEKMIETAVQQKLTELEATQEYISRRVTVLENSNVNCPTAYMNPNEKLQEQIDAFELTLEQRLSKLSDKVDNLDNERTDFVENVINDYDFTETVNDILSDYDPTTSDVFVDAVQGIVSDMSFKVEVNA